MTVTALPMSTGLTRIWTIPPTTPSFGMILTVTARRRLCPTAIRTASPMILTRTAIPMLSGWIQTAMI